MNYFKDEYVHNGYSSDMKLYSRFIKYENLHNMCHSTIFAQGYPREINVYIDLYQMTTSLYLYDNITNPMSLLATIINMPLHYRNYFKKMNIKSNIFLIYSTNKSMNNIKYLEEYNTKYRKRIRDNLNVQNVMRDIINILQTICPYLPGIYLKVGSVEPTVIVYDLASKFNTNGFNKLSIFITSTDYAYQLASKMDSLYVFYKMNAELRENNIIREILDTSFVIHKYNALNMYISRNKNKDLNSSDEYKYLDQSWITPLFVLSGIEDRSVKSLMNYSKALEVLLYLKTRYMNITPENVYNACIDLGHNIINIQDIYNRFYAIDLDYQLMLYRQLPESMEVSFLKDLDDMETLHTIATDYFSPSNTIDLNKL